jgi:hypothetical protein
MGLSRQLRDMLDQLIDDKIRDAREFRLAANTFKPLVNEEIDFALGAMVGEINGLFHNLFVVINKRSMDDEELAEAYHVIRSRAAEIHSALLNVE